MNRAVSESRWLTLFLYAAPIVFLVLLFRDGLKCWFIADDFAWLGLLRQVYNPHDLMRVLFEPAAQGTVRPWSERGFFLLFEYLFGMDALPFRIMAFATMAANLLLVNHITRRITHSPLAGFIAAVCWSANAALMTVMTWSSAYNEALCPLFLLSALALFIRYCDTGKRKFWWWQLVVFILGFGALEINVVYPVLAAAYALFIAPTEKRRTLAIGLWPLFVLSVIYFLWHRAIAPIPTSGPYMVRVDARIFKSLLQYGKWSLLPVDWTAFKHSPALGKAIVWIGIAGVAALLISEALRRRTTILFFITWYLATLAPVLVLPEHFSDYYLTIPLIGFAMLFAYGATCGVRDAGRLRWLALIPILMYLAGMIPVSQSASRWALDKTKPIRAIVLGTEAAHQKHPGKFILLSGIDRVLYQDSVGQGALAPLGLENVYLTPESAAVIGRMEYVADLDRTVLDPDAAIHAIRKDQVVIYSVAGDHLRNITKIYELSAPNSSSDRLPSRIDVGNPIYSWLLGPTWLSIDGGVRWMPGHATVQLRGPDSAGSKLELDGFYPAEQLKRVPRVLRVSIDGIPAGEIEIHSPEGGFHRLLDLQPSVVGKASMEIELDAVPWTLVMGRSMEWFSARSQSKTRPALNSDCKRSRFDPRGKYYTHRY